MLRSVPIILAAAVALVAPSVPAHAANYNFTTLSLPGAPAGDTTYVEAINDNGQVLLDADSGAIFDYVDVDDVYSIHTHSFTPLSGFPGAAPSSTRAIDINDSGQIVGYYHPPGGQDEGYLYSGGSYTSIVAFGSSFTSPIAISNNGKIVGLYTTPLSTLGFVDVGGVFTSLTGDPYPANSTVADSINNAGQIILESGITGSSSPNCDSFLSAGGVNTPINVPGEANTCATDINDKGAIVGYASNDGYLTASSFLDVGGTFTTLQFPGATETMAFDVNNLGDIVGQYTDANGDSLPFLATPAPEPPTWVLLLAGLSGIGALKFQRRRKETAGPVR